MERAHRPHGVLYTFGTLILVVAIGVGALWLKRRHHVRHEAATRGETAARGPRVMVATVESTPAQREVTLPADVRAVLQTTLYAKTAGYLERIEVDNGDRVKKGQLLGVLSSPENDQQVAEARADLVLKSVEAVRARTLARKEFISIEQLDQAEAALKGAQANTGRVRALQRYQVLRAPFDGVVTNRYVDQGALIPAGTGTTAGGVPLVDLADPSRVKVMVYVSQDVAAFLRVDDPATIAIDERPGQKIRATLTRISTALDPRTRTMLVELWLDNPERVFYPGQFVKVTLRVTAPPLPRVPAAAVAMRSGKLVAGVVDGTHLKLVPITTGLDDGRNVQIRTGLKAGMRVALNLPPEIGDGAQIQAVEKGAGGTEGRKQ